MVKSSLESQRRRALQRLGELFRLVDDAMKKGKTEKARLLLDEVQVALRTAREAQGDDGASQAVADAEDEHESRVRRIPPHEVAASKLRAQRQR